MLSHCPKIVFWRRAQEGEWVVDLTQIRQPTLWRHKAASSPDSDSRRIELFRLLNSPVIALEDWRRLARRYTQAEKMAFAERVAKKARNTGLYGLRILELQSKSSS